MQNGGNVPVRNLAAQVQSQDYQDGLESVGPTCQQVEYTVQEQR